MAEKYFWYLLSFFVFTVFCDGISDFLIGQAIQTVNNVSILFIAANAAVSLLMLFFDVVLFRIFMAAVVEKSAA
jgi:hypothetical protein